MIPITYSYVKVIFRLCNYTFYTFVVAYNLSILSVFLAMEAAIIALKEYKVGGTDRNEYQHIESLNIKS